MISSCATGKRHGAFAGMRFPVINYQPSEHEVEPLGVGLSSVQKANI